MQALPKGGFRVLGFRVSEGFIPVTLLTYRLAAMTPQLVTSYIVGRTCINTVGIRVPGRVSELSGFMRVWEVRFQGSVFEFVAVGSRFPLKGVCKRPRKIS